MEGREKVKTINNSELDPFYLDRFWEIKRTFSGVALTDQLRQFFADERAWAQLVNDDRFNLTECISFLSEAGIHADVIHGLGIGYKIHTCIFGNKIALLNRYIEIISLHKLGEFAARIVCTILSFELNRIKESNVVVEDGILASIQHLIGVLARNNKAKKEKKKDVVPQETCFSDFITCVQNCQSDLTAVIPESLLTSACYYLSVINDPRFCEEYSILSFLLEEKGINNEIHDLFRTAFDLLNAIQNNQEEEIRKIINHVKGDTVAIYAIDVYFSIVAETLSVAEKRKVLKRELIENLNELHGVLGSQSLERHALEQKEKDAKVRLAEETSIVYPKDRKPADARKGLTCFERFLELARAPRNEDTHKSLTDLLNNWENCLTIIRDVRFRTEFWEINTLLERNCENTNIKNLFTLADMLLTAVKTNDAKSLESIRLLINTSFVGVEDDVILVLSNLIDEILGKQKKTPTLSFESLNCLKDIFEMLSLQRSTSFISDSNDALHNKNAKGKEKESEKDQKEKEGDETQNETSQQSYVFNFLQLVENCGPHLLSVIPREQLTDPQYYLNIIKEERFYNDFSLFIFMLEKNNVNGSIKDIFSIAFVLLGVIRFGLTEHVEHISAVIKEIQSKPISTHAIKVYFTLIDEALPGIESNKEFDPQLLSYLREFHNTLRFLQEENDQEWNRPQPANTLAMLPELPAPTPLRKSPLTNFSLEEEPSSLDINAEVNADFATNHIQESNTSLTLNPKYYDQFSTIVENYPELEQHHQLTKFFNKKNALGQILNDPRFDLTMFICVLEAAGFPQSVCDALTKACKIRECMVTSNHQLLKRHADILALSPLKGFNLFIVFIIFKFEVQLKLNDHNTSDALTEAICYFNDRLDSCFNLESEKDSPELTRALPAERHQKEKEKERISVSSSNFDDCLRTIAQPLSPLRSFISRNSGYYLSVIKDPRFVKEFATIISLLEQNKINDKLKMFFYTAYLLLETIQIGQADQAEKIKKITAMIQSNPELVPTYAQKAYFRIINEVVTSPSKHNTLDEKFMSSLFELHELLLNLRRSPHQKKNKLPIEGNSTPEKRSSWISLSVVNEFSPLTKAKEEDKTHDITEDEQDDIAPSSPRKDRSI